MATETAKQARDAHAGEVSNAFLDRTERMRASLDEWARDRVAIVG